jgi:hypothetical protein
MKEVLQQNVAKLGKILPTCDVKIFNNIKAIAVKGSYLRRAKFCNNEKNIKSFKIRRIVSKSEINKDLLEIIKKCNKLSKTWVLRNQEKKWMKNSSEIPCVGVRS